MITFEEKLKHLRTKNILLRNNLVYCLVFLKVVLIYVLHNMNLENGHLKRKQ